MRRLYVVRLIKTLLVAGVIVVGALQADQLHQNQNDDSPAVLPSIAPSPAGEALKALPIKGRAPKTGYMRLQFTDGWDIVNGCDMRNTILVRDLKDTSFTEGGICKVATGTLIDPYSAKTILFYRGKDTSDDIQIDHVVSLSDAWQKGAQALTFDQRHAFANDPLNLLAVDGNLNQAKGDGDAATWLPPNKEYRCPYVARQIAVKTKYTLWVTRSEYEAMAQTLSRCPQQTLPN